MSVLSRVRFAKEAFPRCRTGFTAWRWRLSGGAIRSFRGHGRGFPVLRNRFMRVVKTMERTFYPHFSVSRYLFLRICNVNRLISVNICMVSRHRVCCTGAFPPSWRVRSSAVQPELRWRWLAETVKIATRLHNITCKFAHYSENTKI